MGGPEVNYSVAWLHLYHKPKIVKLIDSMGMEVATVWEEVK